jgi:hypothetical protein
VLLEFELYQSLRHMLRSLGCTDVVNKSTIEKICQCGPERFPYMVKDSHCIDRPVLNNASIPDLPHIKVGMGFSRFFKIVMQGTIEERELFTDLVLFRMMSPGSKEKVQQLLLKLIQRWLTKYALRTSD